MQVIVFLLHKKHGYLLLLHPRFTTVLLPCPSCGLNLMLRRSRQFALAPPFRLDAYLLAVPGTLYFVGNIFNTTFHLQCLRSISSLAIILILYPSAIQPLYGLAIRKLALRPSCIWPTNASHSFAFPQCIRAEVRPVLDGNTLLGAYRWRQGMTFVNEWRWRDY